MSEKLSQKQLIVEYIKELGSIVPAKVANSSYKGHWFGEELSKRCRELRLTGMLVSEPDKDDNKYERFYLALNGSVSDKNGSDNKLSTNTNQQAPAPQGFGNMTIIKLTDKALCLLSKLKFGDTRFSEVNHLITKAKKAIKTEDKIRFLNQALFILNQ